MEDRVPATTVAEFVDALSSTAPLGKAAGWDPVGLQIGDPAAPVSSVAVCHEVTDAVVERIEAEPVGLLVAYHALLFRPVRTLRPGADPAGRAYRLVRSGTALAVVHTAFDVAPGGTADALADAIGLEDVSGFGPLWGPDQAKIVVFAPADAVEQVAAAMASAGAGTIGGYTACSFRTEGIGAFTAPSGASPATGEAGRANREPETRLEMGTPRAVVDRVVAALVAAHPYEEPAYDVYDITGNAGFVGRAGSLPSAVGAAELAQRVAAATGAASVRFADPGGGDIRRVAVIPGAGGSLLGAVPAGTDALVTGDVGHHRAREALDRGMAVVDPGHAESERPGIGRLVAAVRAIRPDTIDLTDLDPSPWRAP